LGKLIRGSTKFGQLIILVPENEYDELLTLDFNFLLSFIYRRFNSAITAPAGFNGTFDIKEKRRRKSAPAE
jgi:hypothetical protein